jgi:pseudaminic acid biosynthesis-associated methylase
MNKSDQFSAWTGEFGHDYLARNGVVHPDDIRIRAGCLSAVLKSIDTPPTSILEVGCNVGLNLHALAQISEAALHGVEPFVEAFEKLNSADGPKLASSHCNDGAHLPYDDASIDLVFTSGVLIHVHPDDLFDVMDEVHRVSKRYILCNEYFGKKPEELLYRGKAGLLFKRDFGGAYLDRYQDLKPVAQGFFWQRVTPYDDTTWWLFEKQG